jgi:hypothetical protein
MLPAMLLAMPLAVLPTMLPTILLAILPTMLNTIAIRCSWEGALGPLVVYTYYKKVVELLLFCEKEIYIVIREDF